MISNIVLIGLGTLILTVLIYFAKAGRKNRQIYRSEQEQRIIKVLDAYLDNKRAGKIAEFDGLIKAGVGTLIDDREIRELFKRIIQHGERHPLPLIERKLQDIDLQLFFSIALSEKINSAKANSDQFIEQVRNIQRE